MRCFASPPCFAPLTQTQKPSPQKPASPKKTAPKKAAAKPKKAAAKQVESPVPALVRAKTAAETAAEGAKFLKREADKGAC